VGVVVSGKEQIVHAQNPWDALGFQAAEEAIILFNNGDFSAAVQLLEQTRNRLTDASQKKQFQAFAALCQLFESWERFQHKEALKKLTDVRRDKNDLAVILGQHRTETLWLWLDQTEAKLKPLTAEAHDAAKLRALAEGRYDDAVARLYRAIEAFAQATLHTHGFTDTGKVLLEKIPEALRSEWQTRAEDDLLKLGLQDDYKLLAALGDDAATRFTQLKLDDPQASLLSARNHSILAHGYAPVSKETAEKLFASAMTLTCIQKSDLTHFPTLK
jgi:CRISPR-associated protein (TIGR02710 family)